MSSTNRGYIRHANDFYVTPINVVVDFLKEFNKLEDILTNQEGLLVLDPSAGGSEGNLMSYPEALKQIGVPNSSIMTMDIREDSLATIKGNYLETDLEVKPQVIISNPPFNLAKEFIEKALNDVEEGGFVIALVRLNFFESKARKEMFEKQMPKYSFVHSKRISFTPDGKTDSVAYQHMVFQKGYHPEFTKLKVIA